jgi:hypothetical protein
MITHVKGIPGSGKTWICNALKGSIECYDTDDLITRAFESVKHNAKFVKLLGAPSSPTSFPKWQQMVDKVALENAKKIVAHHKEKKIPAIFVGVTMGDIPGADQRIFIKIEKKDMEKVYRRVILREFQKIKDHASQIEKLIESAPADQISPEMRSMHIEAVDLTTSFAAYKFMYNEAVKGERKRGLKVLSQEAIIQLLKNQLKS